jgi:cellobiose-specific phosphotransferase system component IIC
MNIKLKAAVQVAAFIILATAAAATVRFILNAAAAAYGTQAVIDGIIFATLSTAVYVMVGLLYDIRVTQLQYKAKLQAMVDKSAQKQ